MSFYDDASLVFLPSGGAGKDTKAYSIKPTNGDGDFTFSRGSNLTATRVDSNGLIEKGRENLLLQSNSFNTTWSLSSTSVTSGQSGYDGSSDAWLLNSTTTGFPRIAQNVTSSGVATYSIYAKAAADSFIQLKTFGADSEVWFNLSSGTIVSSSGSQYITSNIQSVGNGWYRCSVTFNGSLTSLRVYPASAFGVYSTSGNGVYIQDAQLEQGLVATEYIESGATKGKAGILEHSPRFDYSNGASCPSLILEGSRTNEIGYSEYFEGWTPQGSPTITSNYGTSPEGLQNSSRLRYTTDSDYIETSVTNTSGVFTIYAKGTGNLILTDSGANASSTTALTSSYQRIELYFSTNTTTLQIKTDSSGLDAEVYGAQFENATYKTSYIPNHSGGSVTREADVCTNSTGGVSQTEGTIFIDYKDSPNKDVLFACSTSSGLITNNIRLSYNQLYIRNSTGNLVVASVTLPDEGKLAIKYDTNGVKIFSNGNSTPIYTNSTRISFDGSVDFVRVGSRVNNAGIEQFNVNQFLIFTTALSDNNCITLTS